ncbi:K(+)-transporting ATPase subunit C [Actinocrinis puniceicyclus]|uniref:Potassium-transporting ATPase KdpC subunit n=1 Tax=Actinocrinis puniceicyclus TaxID=977794 RepID=A0A8J7WJR3_9ACTN|nr:K(+)-transporting ATPase subunit C [Actinocrinis puniceicyclus]MBS2963568.1 K(+)-transporting ATPase subunit C [Actinocrinis puniceicyclus]
MNRLPAPILRHLAALRALLVLTVICGIAYPLLVTGIAQAAFKDKADGSLIKDAKGQSVGSALLCQEFVDAKGNPLPQYFQPRPSNAILAGSTNDHGCDPAQSGGSNLGTNSDKLKQQVADRQKTMAAFDSVPGHSVTPGQVAVDAVTASASGLDPDISPLNAAQQEHRIAATRGITAAQVEALVKANTGGRDLGLLGESGVNVLQLNLALDAQYPYTGKYR